MKNKKVIIGILIIFLFIIIGIVSYYSIKNNNITDTESLEENGDTLDLTGESYKPSNVYDENNKEVSLSDFADKPMVLLFFNTTDINATETLKILQDNYEEYKEEINFIIISVLDNVNETKETIKEYKITNNINIPIVYDTEYTSMKEYEIDKIPTVVFISKNNEIVNSISKDINQDIVEANLDILSENF